MRAHRLIGASAGIVLAFAATSCGGGGGAVDVTLQEFSISTDPTSIGAGEVEFSATNEGPDDTHEFVVFKTDLGITDLPVDENGAVVEDGEGVELIGEIEECSEPDLEWMQVGKGQRSLSVQARGGLAEDSTGLVIVAGTRHIGQILRARRTLQEQRILR